MLDTMPNEERRVITRMEHQLALPVCCPVSGNPRPGSQITLHYLPRDRVLEVFSLRRFVNQFIGGHPDGTRNMEAMIQRITQACANAVGVRVRCKAHLVLIPEQAMILHCFAIPNDLLPRHTSAGVVGENDGAALCEPAPALRPEAPPAGGM